MIGFAVLALAITNVLCVPHNISLCATIHGTPNPSTRRVAMHRTDWALSRVNGHIVVLKDFVMRIGFATGVYKAWILVYAYKPTSHPCI